MLSHITHLYRAFKFVRLNPKPLFLVSGLQVCYAGDGGNSGPGGGSGHGGSDGGGGGKDSDDSKSFSDSFGSVGAFLSGWRSRVAIDPQVPFKVASFLYYQENMNVLVQPEVHDVFARIPGFVFV